VSDQYRTVRQNIARLLDKHPTAATLDVPQCPGWTVRDLLGHLVEVCRIVVEDDGSPIDGGVGAPDLAVADLLASWEVHGAAVDQLLAAGGTRWAGPLLLDGFTHELDLRCVLGEPFPDGHPAFERAFEFAVRYGLGRSVTARGLPAVRVSAGQLERIAGTGEPAISVRGNGFDVYRSVVGRRAPAQIAGLSWSDDPSRWLPAFAWGPFTPPEHPVEPDTPG
jgi:uncharacterized protein (TIGR03083 family)